MIFHSRSPFNNEVCVFKNQQNHRRLVFNSKKPNLIQGEVKFLPNGKGSFSVLPYSKLWPVDCLYIPLRYAQTMLKMSTFFVDKISKNLDLRCTVHTIRKLTEQEFSKGSLLLDWALAPCQTFFIIAT